MVCQRLRVLQACEGTELRTRTYTAEPLSTELMSVSSSFTTDIFPIFAFTCYHPVSGMSWTSEGQVSHVSVGDHDGCRFQNWGLVVIYQPIGTQIHSAFEHVFGDLHHGTVLPHVRTPWMFDQHTTPTFDLILDLLDRNQPASWHTFGSLIAQPSKGDVGSNGTNLPNVCIQGTPPRALAWPLPEAVLTSRCTDGEVRSQPCCKSKERPL